MGIGVGEEDANILHPSAWVGALALLSIPVDPGKQQVAVVQGAGSLPSMWETPTELQASGFGQLPSFGPAPGPWLWLGPVPAVVGICGE